MAEDSAGPDPAWAAPGGGPTTGGPMGADPTGGAGETNEIRPGGIDEVRPGEMNEVRFGRMGLGRTGDERVDEAVARLDELADTPLEEHPAIFEQIHDRLREVLGEVSPGRPGSP